MSMGFQAEELRILEYHLADSRSGILVNKTRPSLKKPARSLSQIRSDLNPALNWQNGRASAHSGMLSCFFHGFSSFLFFSVFSARAMRRRVECGMITSSI